MRYIKYLIAGMAFVACHKPNPIAQVSASFETEPVIEAVGEDAADDPAFWFNKQNPENSFILGSNKKLGLEVYNLKGKRLAHYPIGRINNIDVLYNVTWGDSLVDIVAGSNRDGKNIDIWALNANPKSFKLISDSSKQSKLKDVYGFCLYQDKAQNAYAFINSKTGEIEQWHLKADSLGDQSEIVRTLNAGAQVEGMVADPETGLLYVGIEETGIVVFGADPKDSLRYRTLELSGADNPDLEFDIEGLTIYQRGSHKYLIASSQGNNRYAIFDLNQNGEYLKCFEIVDGVVDGTQETDGIDAFSLPIGEGFPDGLFIAQDGYNYDNESAKPQNFKIVDASRLLAILAQN